MDGLQDLVSTEKVSKATRDILIVWTATMRLTLAVVVFFLLAASSANLIDPTQC
jgi:hypothetical protein